ncbi:MAG: T9SS type A sorting domain-containing protein [Cyclobacteriaceae bacterium]
MKDLYAYSFIGKLILVMSLLIGSGQSTQAQDIFELDSLALSSADLSGEYCLKMNDNNYMLPVAEASAATNSAQPISKLVISKIPNSELYEIKWNDLYMNYSHSWDLRFNAESTNSDWQIELNPTLNTVQFRRGTDNTKYVKYEGGNFYQDGGSGNNVNFELWNVTGIAGSIETPEPELKGLSDLALNVDDISGNYVIQYNETSFMGFAGAALTPTTSEPLYAFDFTRLEDGTYTIGAGDWRALYTHNWELQFGVAPEADHTWIVTVVNQDTVTIQRNDGSGNYIKIEGDAFYQDAGSNSEIHFRLRSTDPNAHITSLTNLIANANELVSNSTSSDYVAGAYDEFVLAIANAQSVLDNAESHTVEEVNAARSSLESAMDTFLASRVTTDFNALNTLIAEAEALVAKADTVAYQEGALTAFSAAIDAAQVIADEPTSTQEEADAAVVDLQEAIDAYNAAEIIPVDFGLLNTHIAEAEALVEKADSVAYQEGALAALESAIGEAQAIADEPNSTQEEVDSAIIDLLAAIGAFNDAEIIPADFTQLNSLIAEAEEIAANAVAEDFIDGAIELLTGSIDSAQVVADNPVAAQDVVDDAISELQVAIEEFLASRAIKIYEIERNTLSAADLSGTYCIKTSAGTFMLPLEGVNPASNSSQPIEKLEIVKLDIDTADLYHVIWNDLYMNYTHDWNLQFSKDSVSNAWQLDLNATNNTVSFRRGTDNTKYIKYEGGAFYHDGSGADFELWTVLGVGGQVETPRPKLMGAYDIILDAADLSGEYIIQYDEMNYMGFETSSLVSATDEPMFVFDLDLQADGSYEINAGDWGAVHSHVFNLQFTILPEEFNTWLIKVVGGDTVTIQRNDGSGNYIKFQGGDFYQDADSTAQVHFRLRTNDPARHLTNLGNVLAEANIILDGYASEEFTEGAYATFEQAVADAQAVLDDGENFTIEQVNTQASELAAAIEFIWDALIPIDYSELDSLIAVAVEVQQTSLVEYFEEGALETFSTAIDAAKVVASNTTAKQVEVDEALEILQAALVALESARLPTNFDDLTSLIAAANAVLDEANLDDYAANAAITLQLSIEEAESTANNADASQAEVDLSVTKLQFAIDVFKGSLLPAVLTLSGELAFEPLKLGESSSLTFTITNDGVDTLKVTSITTPSGFKVDKTEASLTKGASTTVTVTFSPTSSRIFGGDLNVKSNVGEASIVVSGEGESEPVLGLDDHVNLSYGPNPVLDILTISLPKYEHAKPVTVKIIGFDGQVLITKVIEYGDKTEVDLSQLARGLYLLQLDNGVPVLTKKIVKN